MAGKIVQLFNWIRTKKYYPQTVTAAVYDNEGNRLDNIINNTNTRLDAFADASGHIKWVNVDVNTLIESGFYYCSSSSANLPESGKSTYIKVTSASATRISQMAFSNYDSKVYTRIKSDNTWTPWQQLALNSDLTNKPITFTPNSTNVKSTHSYNRAYSKSNHTTICISVVCNALSTNGWNELGTIPQANAPSNDVYFMLYNASNSSFRCGYVSSSGRIFIQNESSSHIADGSVIRGSVDF